jgi:hypothetical protein
MEAPQSDDIVQWLRYNVCDELCASFCDCRAHLQAANEIERLRERLAEAQHGNV